MGRRARSQTGPSQIHTLWLVSDRAAAGPPGGYLETLRIHEDCALYYLTFSVIQWLPVFVSEESCLIITESLNFCHREKGLRINAFVIMPTHLHLIVTDADYNVERLRQTITDLRKYTGKQLARYAVEKGRRYFVRQFKGHCAKTVPTISGGKVAMQRGFTPTPSGKRNSTICMIIHVAKVWYARQPHGGFPRQSSGCWNRQANLMWN